MALNSNVKQPRMAARSSILAPTNTSGGAPGVAGTPDLTTGKEGEVFGSDSELLFARSQLPHRCLPLPRLAPLRCASSFAVLQEAKRPNFLAMAVSDSMLAHVINLAHSHNTEGAILCQWGKRITSKGEELDSRHGDVSCTSARQTHLFIQSQCL